MEIHWDSRKAAANLRRHGVSFEEAATSLHDPLSATARDPDHSVGEYRFITFALSPLNRLLVVSHAEEGGVIRIISARIATKNERRIYEEG